MKKLVAIVLFTGLLASTIELSQSANVLFLLPIASKSHKRAFEPLVNGLAERNHKVTVVSPIKPSKDKKNIREIVTNSTTMDHFGDPLKLREEGTSGMLSRNFDFIYEACHRAYQDEEFKTLHKEQFDLIFIDAFGNDPFYGFIHQSGAPFVIISPQSAHTALAEYLGNVLPSSFVPSALLPFKDEMSFKERLINFLINAAIGLLWSLKMVPKGEAVYRKELGKDLPSMGEILANASMIFMNSHFTQTFPKPLLPDLIEIGGMHCQPAKPLPQDWQEFADGAKDGLILFSLGSIIQGNQMPEATRKVFLSVFSRLKQRVIWKWETGSMPDLPPNVKLSPWVPQQDILGHPNLRIFMTHGGLLSTQEAIYHGAPLLAIPIFGDQNLNAFQAEQGGYALTLEILGVTEEDVETKIMALLNNKSFNENAKKLSKVFRDQPQTPLERAIFWSEYIMRHKGAQHLRSAARKLNMIQYHSLDVVALLATVLVGIIWLIKVIIVKVFRVICRVKSRTNKSDVKKNQ